RSPCPLLNTLANHGFLNRDGRSLTMYHIDAAIMSAMNMDLNTTQLFTANCFTELGLSTTDPSVAIDLEDLNAHGLTEHDASLTRLDKIQGDTLRLQPHMLDNMLNDAGPSPFLNTTSMGRTRARRERESLAAGSPILTSKAQGSCMIEAALVLVLLG
ncbi:Cloroperoxidase, partial [Trichodelitschia bisporula]